MHRVGIVHQADSVRQVLQALLSSHRPLGAYEVIDELAKSMPRPAPITVYRALDFLLANGFIHKLESVNAFVACHHPLIEARTRMHLNIDWRWRGSAPWLD